MKEEEEKKKDKGGGGETGGQGEEHTTRMVLPDQSVLGAAGGHLTCTQVTGLKYAGLPLSKMKFFYLY